MPPVLHQGAEMLRQRRQPIVDVVGCAGRDGKQRSPVPRHRIGPQRLALDDPGVSVARLLARLPAVDKRNRPSATLQLQGSSNADHSGAKNNRAFHYREPANPGTDATTAASIFAFT